MNEGARFGERLCPHYSGELISSRFWRSRASLGEWCPELSGNMRSSIAAKVQSAGNVPINRMAYRISDLVIVPLNALAARHVAESDSLTESPYLCAPCRNWWRALRSSTESLTQRLPSSFAQRLQVRHPVRRSPLLSISTSSCPQLWQRDPYPYRIETWLDDARWLRPSPF